LEILITGISGFLGKNLAKHFNKNNYSVSGIDLYAGYLDNIKIAAAKDLDTLNIINPDVVIICHAAVASGSTIIESKLLFETNVTYTQKIAEKFYNSKLIYISTASIYQNNQNIISEHSNILPQSEYAVSKLWAEHIVLKYNKTTILRLSSLFGIGMKENTIIPNYINQAMQNKTIEVWGDGKRVQNYIHINDVVNIIECIIKKNEITNQKILLGVSNNEYSNIELANIIADLLNARIVFTNQDNSISLRYDNLYTQKLLSWKAEKNLRKQLKEYIEWKQRKY
jgi:UDP-glucose 4-epimerase